MNHLKQVVNKDRSVSISSESSSPTSKGSVLRGLKLIIDARKVHDGGIGRYIQNLLDGLDAFTSLEITVICFPQDTLFFYERYDGRVATFPSTIKLYSLGELFGLSRAVPWKKYDLAHFPHFTVPYGISIPTVVTIHDLIQITNPEKWYYPYIGRTYIRNALHNGKTVIAVSNQTAKQLLPFNSKGVPIRVIPNSLSRSTDESEARSEAIPAGVQEGFFLAVLSNSKPHKGLARLMDAYRILSTNYEIARSRLPQCGLILVGSGAPKGSFYGGMGMGRVSEDELTWYYAHARGVVVASDIEGFCLPIIEGRRLGVPAVVTPIPAVTEIVSKYDVVAESFSSPALAAAMAKLLNAPPPPRFAMQFELERFDLQRVTQQIIKTYEDIFKNVSAGYSTGKDL